jgi:hypothetical protein
MHTICHIAIFMIFFNENHYYKNIVLFKYVLVSNMMYDIHLRTR